MDKIVITGANGFFASRFIEYYKSKYDIIGFSRNELDTTDEIKVIQTIKAINPDYVIHTAAIADTNLCERNSELSFQVNVKGSINIAKACLNSKAKLIHLSSEQVYNGNVEEGPYNESCTALPNTIYGNHKIEAETEISKIIEEAVILRFNWIFGTPEKNKKVNANILWNVLKATIKNEKIKLPIHEYRGMTYVYDFLDNFYKIINLPAGIYNTGSENNFNTYEVGELILKEMGLNSRIEDILIKDTEKYKVKARDLRINNEKLKKYNIYIPNTEDSIKRCVNDFSLNKIY